MKKELLDKLVEEAIGENPSLFLVDLKVSGNNSIEITVDGDEGVSIDEIVRISRYVESSLNAEEQDFSLNVYSAGVGNPLIMPRQYKKNVGRKLKVAKTDDSKEIEGQLEEVTDEGILLKWKQREPKPVGKGKHTVEREEFIGFEEIKKAIVKISF